MKTIKNPCRGCIYFKVCGENTRTKPCDGRTTKTDKKRENENKKYFLKK